MRGIFDRLPLRQTAKRVIWLRMAGDPSHLNTFDPKLTGVEGGKVFKEILV
jgi:hypothetical protein